MCLPFTYTEFQNSLDMGKSTRLRVNLQGATVSRSLISSVKVILINKRWLVFVRKKIPAIVRGYAQWTERGLSLAKLLQPTQ